MCLKVDCGYVKEISPVEARSMARKRRVLSKPNDKGAKLFKTLAAHIAAPELPGVGDDLNRLQIQKCRVACSDRPAPRAEVGGFVLTTDGALHKIHLFTLRTSHGADFKDVAKQLADGIAARRMTRVQALAHRDSKFA